MRAGMQWKGSVWCVLWVAVVLGITGCGGSDGPSTQTQANAAGRSSPGTLAAPQAGPAPMTASEPASAPAPASAASAASPSTPASSPTSSPPVVQATLTSPANLVVDRNGIAYIADLAANRIVKRTPSGDLTVLAGDAASAQAGYVDAQGTAARFNKPRAVALSPDQTSLYVADTGNRRVRRISLADGTVSTYAGTGNPGSFGDAYDEIYSGSGSTALTADFFGPTALAVNMSGDLYVLDAGADQYGSTTIGIRLVAVNGQVTTIGGGGADARPADSNDPVVMQFGQPGARTLELAFDASVNALYVADDDRVRKIDLATGTSYTLTGSAPRLQWTSLTSAQSSQKTAELPLPQGVAVDSVGRLFVADSQRVSVMMVASDGTLSTFVAGDLRQGLGSVAFTSVRALASDASNNLYLLYNFAPIRLMLIAPNATETPLL